MAQFSKGTFRMKSFDKGGLGDITKVLLARMEKFFQQEDESTMATSKRNPV